MCGKCGMVLRKPNRQEREDFKLAKEAGENTLFKAHWTLHKRFKASQGIPYL